MQPSSVRAKLVGATAFIAQVCRDLGIAAKINRMVEWDETQWKISPGTRAVALIINIICHRQPLYRVWTFYEHLDLGLLFDEPLTSADLNDDGFARTLDRLHGSGELRRLIHSVALAAVNRLPFGIRSVHADFCTGVPRASSAEHHARIQQGPVWSSPKRGFRCLAR